jgi:hypothetical protein
MLLHGFCTPDLRPERSRGARAAGIVFTIGFVRMVRGVPTCTDVVGTLGASAGTIRLVSASAWTGSGSDKTGAGSTSTGSMGTETVGVRSLGACVAGLGVWSAMSLFGEVTVGGVAGVGVCTRGATSLSSRVMVGLTGARTGCGRGVGLSEDEGASCGLAKGNGGSPDPFEPPIALCLPGKAGGRAPFAWGAVALVIGAAACLVGMGTPLGGVGAETAGVRSLGAPVAGVCGRMGCGHLVGRKSLALGTGPIDESISVAQSNRLGSHAVSSTVHAGRGAPSSRLVSPISSSYLISSLSVFPSFSSLVCCLSSCLSSPFSLLSFSPSSVLPSSSSLLRPVLSCCSTVAATATVVVSTPCAISLIVPLAGLGGMSLSSVFFPIWSLSAPPICAVGVGVRTGVGAEAGVAVSELKATIGSVVVCSTLDWVAMGDCSIESIARCAGVKMGVESRVSAGVATGTMESKAAGLGVMVVTGRALDRVSVDSRVVVP